MISRRNFIKNTAVAATATVFAGNGVLGASTLNCSEDYAALRKQLRAFYPDECHGKAKDIRQIDSVKKIQSEIIAYTKLNPNYDALDIRKKLYESMRTHFVPFIFTESPFYFEAGVNGGWAGARPARMAWHLCSRFYREKNLIPDEAFKVFKRRNKERLTLCCGPFVDSIHHIPPARTILSKGFGGVYADVQAALKSCPSDDILGKKELQTALEGLKTLHKIQLSFADEAERRLKDPSLTEKQRNNFKMIAQSAKRCPWEPPKTFYEGLNTLWFMREILGYIDGVSVYAMGRCDAWLYGLYKADIAEGRLTAAQAKELIAKFMITADCHHDGMRKVDGYDDHEMEIPITLGGCDKYGNVVYNDLTKMFIEMHYAADCVFPKLHCRISSNSPQEYFLQIGDMLMKGHCVFALFNDDRHIPYYKNCGFSDEDAREYVACGCWNGYIDSVMDVDDANYVSVVRTLELSIYQDKNLEKEAQIEIEPLQNAKSASDAQRIAYRNFIKFFRSVMGQYTRYGRQIAKVSPYPVYSMCLKGAIESRRDTTDGGVASRPRVITLAFLGNVVDSLLAIEYVCFDKKICTIKELLNAVRNNWEGDDGQRLRAEVLKAPYWGDGSKKSCEQMAWWIRKIHDDTEGFTTDQNDSYHLAILIYREFMYWGNGAKATPDGRYNGDRFAQGFSPSEYRCKEGITTVLNSIATLPHECLIASNANLTFDKHAMSAETFAAIFRVFAKKCGHLLQPNCNSVEDLMDAQKHPERHMDLMVKVCGFSARFVALSERWQNEVIERHRLV